MSIYDYLITRHRCIFGSSEKGVLRPAVLNPKHGSEAWFGTRLTNVTIEHYDNGTGSSGDTSCSTASSITPARSRHQYADHGHSPAD
eukprot:11406720-Heterocapsa_arctica.AAC.1